MDRGRGDGEETLAGQGGQAPQNPAIDVTVPPAKDIVDSIIAMGISRHMAEMAVQQTGADTAEGAIAWVFENNDMMGDAGDDSSSDMYQDYKMVFVVNSSLPMSPGKMAAQVGHAAIGIYADLISKQDIFGGPLLQWNENGSRKIVLKCDNTAQLDELANQAEKSGLPYSKIEDAGLTQIPAGSQTVLAIFGLASAVDKVTGQLELLP